MIGKDFAQQLFNLRDRVAFVTGAGSASPFSASARICGNSAADTTAGIINWIKDQTTVLVTST